MQLFKEEPIAFDGEQIEIDDNVYYKHSDLFFKKSLTTIGW